MVIHIAEGDSIDGIWRWQAGNHDVSSYFIVGKDGTVWQCVDLRDRAWTQAAGNVEWIGVENAGWHTTPLTTQQVEANARLFAWLNVEYGVPLALTDDPTNGRGLGWHGMGGAAWGGHFGCPGDPIKAQRPEILDRAKQIVTPTPAPPVTLEETEMMLMRANNAPEVWLVTNSKTHVTADAYPFWLWTLANRPGALDPNTKREWVVDPKMLACIPITARG